MAPSSSLFVEHTEGRVQLTRRGVVAFWCAVLVGLALGMAMTLATFPLAQRGALLQALLSPLLHVVPALFLVAPGVVGWHFLGGERGWVKLSLRARALVLGGGIALHALLTVAHRALGLATGWSGGDMF